MNETNQWMPIETAPRDGSKILVCNFYPLEDRSLITPEIQDSWYAPTTAQWRTYHPNAQGKPTWRNIDGVKIFATHWQPLPEKPLI